jgi:hypothetical protein
VTWAEDFEREPNPDADPLHLAYDSVYTHEGDIREELLESWVEASGNGKRWRCWNCGRVAQRFTQLRLPTLRTVISICDNCGTWTVWDAWRDLANPRIFNFRRTYEETEPASIAEPGPPAAAVAPAVRSNGSGSEQATGASTPAGAGSGFGPAPASPIIETAAAGAPSGTETRGEAPVTEPALQPEAAVETVASEAKPKRTRATRAKSDNGQGEAKPRASRSRAKKASAEASTEEASAIE